MQFAKPLPPCPLLLLDFLAIRDRGQDPALLRGRQGGLHQCDLYSYGRNNPLTYNDPSGEFALNAVTGVVGAVVGGTEAGVMEYSTGPADNKGMRVFASVVGGAIGGGTVGASLGMAAAGGFVGDAAKQGILNLAGVEKGYSVKSAAIATGAAVGTVVDGFLGSNIETGANKAISNGK